MQQIIPLRCLSFCAGTALELAATLRRWQRRARTRAHLAQLPPPMLADIGLSDLDRWRECNKHFWEP